MSRIGLGLHVVMLFSSKKYSVSRMRRAKSYVD